MDLHALWQSAAEIIREIPRSGLLVATIAAVLGSVIGTAIARRFGSVKAGGLDAVIAPNIGKTNVIGMNLLSRLASWRVEGRTMILVPHNPQPVASQ
jgi:aspartyl protease family protein